MSLLRYDLHIHSCLSPCADRDMTPANLTAMAALKGLDVIAVTDHNSCKNCPAVLHEAQKAGILALPGMELCTSEEVHAVCLFAELDAALRFDAYVYSRLPRIRNREDLFGKQELYGTDDACLGTEPLLLLSAAELSFDGLWELVRSFGGVMFPAHIDRPSNSLLQNLGFVPPDSLFTAAEVWNGERLPELTRQNPRLERCRILSNSDAHTLGEIHEPGPVIEAEEPTALGVLQALLYG